MADDSPTLTKRRLNRKLIVVVGLIVFTVAVTYQSISILDTGPRFHIGKPLPLGKIAPQISIDINAAFIAPDGSLWAWGRAYDPPNSLMAVNFHAIESPILISPRKDWRAISVGGRRGYCLRNDDTLWEVNLGLALLANLEGTSNSGKAFRQLGTESDWAEVSVGLGHMFALKKGGSLWGMGENECAQLGLGHTDSPVTNLVEVQEGSKWKSVSAGQLLSYGLRDDGIIMQWGRYDLGENTLVPTQISPGTNWVDIATGSRTLAALKSDGTIWISGLFAEPITGKASSWPAIDFSQLGSGSNWVEIVHGGMHTWARSVDGNWWSGGINSCGQLGRGYQSKGSGNGFEEPAIPLKNCTLAANGITTLIYAPDGRIWSVGVRVGAKNNWSLKDRLLAVANEVLDRFGKSRRYETGLLPYDVKPHLVWQWPLTNSP